MFESVLMVVLILTPIVWLSRWVTVEVRLMEARGKLRELQEILPFALAKMAEQVPGAEVEVRTWDRRENTVVVTPPGMGLSSNILWIDLREGKIGSHRCGRGFTSHPLKDLPEVVTRLWHRHDPERWMEEALEDAGEMLINLMEERHRNARS